MDRFQGRQLLAVPLVDAPELKVIRRRRERTFAGRRLPDRAEIAEVQRRPGDVRPARRAREEPRRGDGADRRRDPRQRVHRPVMMMLVMMLLMLVIVLPMLAVMPVMMVRRREPSYRDTAPLRAQAELASPDQRTPPGGLEPLLRQEPAVVAARRVQDAVVRRTDHRVRDDEPAVGRAGDLTQRPAPARVRRVRAQELPQEI